MADLKNIVKDIEKQFGKEALVGENVDIEKVSSGCLSIDLALGGGFPKGRVIELVGMESSGKSSLALHLISEVQKEGKVAVYIDSEHALDPEYAKNLGVDVDVTKENPLFYLSQPDNAEMALSLAVKFLESNEVGVLVIDSVAALVPKARIAGEVGDAKMALVARLMSEWLPVIAAKAKKTNCIVLAINQYRERPGVMYGSPLYAPGGSALKFYASQRIEIARCGQNKDGDEVISNKTRIKVIKNKVAVPFKTTEFAIVFGKGIDKFQDIIDIAVELDVIKKAGSWFSYGETRLGQGMNAVITIMEDNPELFEEIRNKVIDKISE